MRCHGIPVQRKRKNQHKSVSQSVCKSRSTPPSPQLPFQLLRLRHDKINHATRQHTLHPHLSPIPPPPTPLPPISPPLPISPPVPLRRRSAHSRIPAFFPPTALGIPPQITRNPNLHAPTNARRTPYNSPHHHRPFLVSEYGQLKMCSGPTYPLQRQQPDEGRYWRVIKPPARQQPRRKAQTLVPRQDGPQRRNEVIDPFGGS